MPAPQILSAEMAEIETLPEDAPRVGIIAAEKADVAALEPACTVLKAERVGHEVRVLSAHIDTEALADYCRNARMRGLRVIIAGAGRACALPGLVAAHTDLPVIGVPLSGGPLSGLDALLGCAQVPDGVPLATVGVDQAANAGHLALRILAA